MFFKRIQLVKNPFCKTLTWVVLAVFLFSTSCTTTRVLSSGAIEPQPDTLRNELKKGDSVRITTKRGKSFELRIADLSSEAIISSEDIIELRQRTGARYRKVNKVLFTEIARIEKLEADPEILRNELKKGDRVKITTNEGSTFELRIAELSSEAIMSSGEIIELRQKTAGGYRKVK